MCIPYVELLVVLNFNPPKLGCTGGGGKCIPSSHFDFAPADGKIPVWQEKSRERIRGVPPLNINGNLYGLADFFSISPLPCAGPSADRGLLWMDESVLI